MDFLNAEAGAWQEEGIISQEQAENILSLYEVKQNSLNRILFIAGGILLGLGAVSLLAAHWHEFPKILRVCVILAGYMLSLGASIFLGRTTKAGRAFLLLASVIFGAGIYLITRMYNYKLAFSEVLGYWLVELLATTILARDEWHLYFTQAVSLVYLLAVNAIDIFALEFMSSAKFSLMQFFEPLSGFALLAALWAVQWRIKDRTAFNINMLLTLLVITSRMSLCFGGTWTLIILFLLGTALSFTRSQDVELLGLLLSGLCGFVLTWAEMWSGIFSQYGNILAVTAAVITACVMLVQIWRGHIAAGITFCVMLIVRYFFDHLFGYMSKAVGFGIAGVIFLAAGIYTSIKHSAPPEPEQE